MDAVRIGSGAGFAGDRIQPAVDLVREGALDDLVLECLAERTIALAQQRRRSDPSTGYDARAEQWLRALLPVALDRGTRIVSNLGAANPLGAGRLAIDIARELGLSCGVAVVTGDDVLDALDLSSPCLEDGRPWTREGPVVSANAYLGADAICRRSPRAPTWCSPAASPTRRCSSRPWPTASAGTCPTTTAAHGTLVGHLLECGTSSPAATSPTRTQGRSRAGTPGIPMGRRLGQRSGGAGQAARHRRSPRPAHVREQLLYEIGDPGAYLTPDVVLDLYGVTLTETAPDRVRVAGAAGRTRPDQLKVSVGYQAGHRAEAGISYAGPGASSAPGWPATSFANALATLGKELRIDVVGSLSDGAPGEVAQCWLRVAGLTRSLDEAADDLPRGRVALHQRTGRRRRRTNAGHRSHRHRLDPG